MAKLKNIESRIERIEGFQVRVTGRDGRDVRGDLSGLPQYPKFDRMAKNAMTVSDWRSARFNPSFAGFDVEVLYANGHSAPGNTKLGTVRDTYLD